MAIQKLFVGGPAAALAVALAACLSGCSVLGFCGPCGEKVAPITEVIHSVGPILATVDLPLSEQPLVLADALDLVIKESSLPLLTEDKAGLFLVRLSRGGRDTYVPYQMARLTQLGTIRLKARDTIQIVPIGETALAQTVSLGTIQVAGFLHRQDGTNLTRAESVPVRGRSETIRSLFQISEDDATDAPESQADSTPMGTEEDGPAEGSAPVLPAAQPPQGSQVIPQVNPSQPGAGPTAPETASIPGQIATKSKPDFVMGWTVANGVLLFPEVCLFRTSNGGRIEDFVIPLPGTQSDLLPQMKATVAQFNDIVLQNGGAYSFITMDLVPTLLASNLENAVRSDIASELQNCMFNGAGPTSALGRAVPAVGAIGQRSRLQTARTAQIAESCGKAILNTSW